MSNRRQRRLDHLKTQKGKIDKGYPKKEEARQGHSVTKFIEGKGLYEFTYYNNQWYSKKLDTVNQADSTFSSEVRTNNLVVEPGGSVNMKGAQSIKGIKAEDIQNTPLAGTVTPGYIGQIGALKFSLPATEPGQIGFNNESQEFELKRSEDDKLVYDGTNLKSVRNVNDGNPTFQLGASDTECFKIETTYSSGGKSLSNVEIKTLTDGTGADLGKITIKIDEARHTILEDSGLRLYGKTFSINDSADTGDIFKIETTTHGATTISTVDDDATAAHLTLDADGAIFLDSATGRHNFYYNGDTDDYMRIAVGANGATSFITYDSDGAEGHLSLAPDGKIKFAASDGVADSIQCNVGGNTFAAFQVEDGSYSQLRLYENGGESSNDYLQIKCEEHGATTISTLDAAAAAAHLILEADGDLLIKAGSGGSFIKETASATTDRAGYGQVWIKSDTPNELCFTDDAGTDITGIGKYHYQVKNVSYYAGATANYLPMNGYIIERTSTASNNEHIAFIAPYDGTLEKFMFRSEAGQDGAMSLRVFESSDGTEVPGSSIFRKDLSVDIDDDTTLEYDMTSPGIGSFPAALTKGRIYAIYLSTPSISYDTNATVVFKWDITS